jgi:hypothetical protein
MAQYCNKIVPWSLLLLGIKELRMSAAFSTIRSSRKRQLSSAAVLHNNFDTRRISYITDVEGDKDYLERFVRRSKVVSFTPCQPQVNSSLDHDTYFPYTHQIDFQDDSSVLVYGGDVWDQGGSDLYVIRQLLSFKHRYPDRVFFIMGNRDINKMRMPSELGPSNSKVAPKHTGVYWLDGTGKTGDPRKGEWLDECPVERLKWMLQSTMGSPKAFEHRKWELEQEQSCLTNGIGDVTPMDVVESYRNSTNPITGEMSKYLKNASLVLRLGEILFVHGGLPLTNDVLDSAIQNTTQHTWDDLTFALPWLKSFDLIADDFGYISIENWLIALNDFSGSCIESWMYFHNAFKENLHWSTRGGYSSLDLHAYSNLLQLGMGWLPNSQRNPTVVYQSWSTDGMPRRFFPTANAKDQKFVELTRDFFRRTSLRLILSGHQPQGDMPNTIRIDGCTKAGKPAYILSCDTSYSGDTSWSNMKKDPQQRENHGRGSSRSGRGMVAVSEVLIEQCTTTGRVLDVYTHGVISDGTEYESISLDMDGSRSNDKLTVGKLAPPDLAATCTSEKQETGPWWVKSAFKDGSYMLDTGNGFQKCNRIVKP